MEIVNRETEAWNTKNAELLMTIFHHDMDGLGLEPLYRMILLIRLSPGANIIILVGKNFGRDYLMHMS